MKQVEILEALFEFGKIGLSAILAAFTAIWVFRRQQREVLYGVVDWDWLGNAPDPEVAFVAIQNRTTARVMIKSFDYECGFWKRKVPRKIALYYEDPSEVNFPFEIEEGKTRKFRLDEDEITRLADEVGFASGTLLQLFGMPRIRLCATTMAGTEVRTPLESVVVQSS